MSLPYWICKRTVHSEVQGLGGHVTLDSGVKFYIRSGWQEVRNAGLCSKVADVNVSLENIFWRVKVKKKLH